MSIKYYNILNVELLKELPCDSSITKYSAGLSFIDRQGGLWRSTQESIERESFHPNYFSIYNSNYNFTPQSTRGIIKVDKSIYFGSLGGMSKIIDGQVEDCTIFENGDTNNLTKPFSVPELLTRINNVLTNFYQRKQWRTAQILNNPKDQNLAKSESNAMHCNASILDANAQKNSPGDKKFIEDLRDYVESNLTNEELDVESLAKSLFMSPRHLFRKTKSITGMSLGKFISEVRLQKARVLLENETFNSVNEVSYAVGFAQAATFSLRFKERFGIVPSKNRNTLPAELSSKKTE